MPSQKKSQVKLVKSICKRTPNTELAGWTLKGPMSPLYAAQTIVDFCNENQSSELIKLWDIYRITFEDDETWNRKDGAEGRTYNDHLVVVGRYKSLYEAIVCIDEGTRVLPVAVSYINTIEKPDKPEFTTTQIFRQNREIMLADVDDDDIETLLQLVLTSTIE